jgi:anti-sigma factor RsiW
MDLVERGKDADDITGGQIATMIGYTAALIAVTDFVKALDPPDWNYKTVQLPSTLSLPATGNATVDKLVKDSLTLASYEAASLHAAERWQAASIVGDTASAAMQLKAYNQYTAQAKNTRPVVASDRLAASKVVPTVDVNSIPGGATAVAAKFNALSYTHLPTELNASLLKLGLTQTEINQRVSAIAKAIRPSDIKSDLKSALIQAVP